jgi:hypothetical protein
MSTFVDYVRLETFVGSATDINIVAFKDSIQGCVNRARQNDSELFLFLSFAWESCPETFWYDKIVLPVRNTLQQSGIKHYKFVFNNSILMYSTERSDKSDCIFLEFMAMLTYDRIFHRAQATSDRWYPEHGRSLMLIGKAEKANRLPLLRQLLNLTGDLDYSLHMNHSIMAAARRLLPELQEDEYYDWCNNVCKSLDPIDIELQDGSSNYVGFPYDAGIYRSRCVSIIPETNYANIETIIMSEKTWRTMVNKHPFIMASVPGTLEYLRSLGFRTFEQYLIHPDYDQYTDDDTRLAAVVSNATHFMENRLSHVAGINADIEHNYQMFQDMVQAEIKKVDSVLDSLYDRTDVETAWSLVSRM